MRYRVDDLAARCGVSVDTVRYYQRRGLLPRPDRAGRVAWYGDEHLDRIGRIRELQARGFTLDMIARVLAGDVDPSEEALARALTGPLSGEDTTCLLTLAQLADETGVSLPLLEAIQREGLLVARMDSGQPRYTPEDAGVVKAGLALLEAGVPLSELMALARDHDEAMRGVAERAVDLFARYVRDPIRGGAVSDADAAAQQVDALHAMLPATSAIVAHHFRRRLLDAARARIQSSAEPRDLAATHADAGP